MPHAPWAHNTIVRVAIKAVCLGQQVVNVFHFEATAVNEAAIFSDALAQAAAQDLVSEFNSGVMTAWLAGHINQYAVFSLQGQVIERPGNRNHRLVAFDYTTGFPRYGALTGGNIDDMTTAVCMKWTGLLAGKSHRSRTFAGPLTDAQTDQGQIVGGTVTLYNTFISTMLGIYGEPSGTDADWRLTCYSRPYDQGEYGYVRGSGSSRVMYFPPDYNGNSSFLMAGSVDTIARTQRRRELGVGA